MRMLGLATWYSDRISISYDEYLRRSGERYVGEGEEEEKRMSCCIEWKMSSFC
jgi:hypothetical protein